MDIGLTTKPTPPPASEVSPRERRDGADEAAQRRPARSTDGAVPGMRPSDARVERIDQLQRMAEEAFAADNLKLSISYDEAAGRFVYRGLDPATGEIVREYPPQEVLDRIARLRKEVTQARAGDDTGISLDKVL